MSFYSVAWAEDARYVIVEAVYKANVKNCYAALGTVRAEQSVDITSQVAGRVERILFRDGEQVNAGQLLVVLDRRKEEALLAIAELTMEAELRELQRLQSLQAKGAAHQGAVDARETEYAIAVQRVEELRASLANHTIEAPFSGTLGLRHMSVGTFVQPGDKLVQLDSTEPMELDFTVPEVWLSHLSMGQRIAALSDAWEGQAFPGEITALDNRVDSMTRAILVRARLDPSSVLLRPGQLMRVSVCSAPRLALVISESALVPRRDRHYVWVVTEKNQAEEREVQVGVRRLGTVEIVEGVQEGERIVVEGLQSLRPGQAVRVSSAARNGDTH